MAKESGIGANFYVGGYNLSGDVGALSVIRGSLALLDVTGLDKAGMERLGGLADGEISFAPYFNPTALDLSTHVALGGLPTANRFASYLHRPTLGAPAANIEGKQINYDWTRGQDGSLLGAVQVLGASGKGLEWGFAITPGRETDTTGTNGTGYDTGVVTTSFGWSAYAHYFSLTGTNLVLTIEDSADGAAWAPLSGGAFPSVVLASFPTAQRIVGDALATVRRHLRVVSSGTFSNAVFAVTFVRHEAAQRIAG